LPFFFIFAPALGYNYGYNTNMKLKDCILLTILMLLTAACEREDPPFSPPASTRRTVLVYLGADNNFFEEAIEKIETLRYNWDKTNDGNLLIYSDKGNNPVLIHIYYDYRKGNVADTIEIYPAENSANPQTLNRVLNRVKAYRPAKSYGLVVLSHASGWLPAEMSEPSLQLRSVILDKSTDEPDNYMEIVDFAAVIPYKLDFIIFDTCFMGSVEVACELKDKADYIVASPAEVISPGFVYSSMMSHLFQAQPDLTAVAEEFYDCFNKQSGLFRSATVSVIKTAELEALKTLFQEIAGMLKLSLYHNDVNRIQTFGYGDPKIYFDLGDCIRHIAPGNYAGFQTALDKCVIYKANTSSYYSTGTGALEVIREFSGLSVYIPQDTYPIANEMYNRLKWNN
jgi:hypothetical protein